jgi:hypothetical protein
MGVDGSLDFVWSGLAKVVVRAFSPICRYLPGKVVPET